MSIIYFTPIVRETLERLSTEDKVAKGLLEIEGTNSRKNITFIDHLASDDYFTFSQDNKLKNLLGVFYKIIDNSDIYLSDQIWKNRDEHSIYSLNNRESIKIGKLVNKLLPNKYSNSDVEVFVNKFKSLNILTTIEIVEGQDIAKWYNEDNYLENRGLLGSSCMRYKECSEFFKIYTENPESVRLLLLKKGNKLVGRALIWKIKSSKVLFKSFNKIPILYKKVNIPYFLDKIYTINNSDSYVLRNYAKSNGWAYYIKSKVTYKDITYDKIKLTVKLKPSFYKHYPYLDTFKSYNPKRGELYNYRIRGNYRLDSTNGGFSK